MSSLDPLRSGPLASATACRGRLAFGGAQLTATDIAVAAGLLELGDRRKVAASRPADLPDGARRRRAMVEEASTG